MYSRPAVRSWIRRSFEICHLALWALATAGIVVTIINVPRISEARATADRQRALEISEENRFYCEKWGMKVGTHGHTLCTLDLQEICAKVEQNFADEIAF